MWLLMGVLVLVVAVLAVGAWLLVPTIRTFRGPDFEPSPKDDASVERAQQSGTTTGAGGAGV